MNVNYYLMVLAKYITVRGKIKMTKKVVWRNIPNIQNLLKSKMFKYSAGFIYLFAFTTIIGTHKHYILFLLLTIMSIILLVMSVVYDVKFVLDNLR